MEWDLAQMIYNLAPRDPLFHEPQYDEFPSKFNEMG